MQIPHIGRFQIPLFGRTVVLNKVVMPTVFLFSSLVSLFAVGYFWIPGGILLAMAFLICAYGTIISREKESKMQENQKVRKNA
jgi:hypothetical protein